MFGVLFSNIENTYLMVSSGFGSCGRNCLLVGISVSMLGELDFMVVPWYVIELFMFLFYLIDNVFEPFGNAPLPLTRSYYSIFLFNLYSEVSRFLYHLFSDELMLGEIPIFLSIARSDNISIVFPHKI